MYTIFYRNRFEHIFWGGMVQAAVQYSRQGALFREGRAAGLEGGVGVLEGVTKKRRAGNGDEG